MARLRDPIIRVLRWWIWQVSWICEPLGVSRSGFHARLLRALRARARKDDELGAKVRASFISSDLPYGAHRIRHDLLPEGLSCGLHRVERLMRKHGFSRPPLSSPCSCGAWSAGR